MRVFLISANEECMPDPVPPLGLAYIAAAVREAGHECFVFDCNFQKATRNLAGALKEVEPHLIGLSLRNVDNTAYPYGTSYLEHYRALARICKAHGPEVPLVLGGSAFSLFPKQFLAALNADVGIVGEGEGVFPQLLESFERAGSLGKLKKSRNFRSILYPTSTRLDFDTYRPARDLLDVATYFKRGGSINLQTKRGCRYSCTYCTYPLLEGAHIRKRPPTSVVDEMETCMRDYGVDVFFFVDSVFNQPPSHAQAIAEEIIRRRLKVKWTAYISPANTSQALFAKMAEAGCASVDFGTDGAASLSLAALGKAFGPSQVRNSSAWCKEAGIKFNHSLLFGAPGETIATIEQTIETVMACQPTAVTAFFGIRLYPNTPLALTLEREGKLDRGAIGIDPIFFVEEQVREYLLDRMKEVVASQPNWIVPGLGKNMNKRLFQRMRARGVTGPLWEML